ncbi:hypothetical protein ATANTOWER_005055 [Ataeniobius toweri]|uniref:Uncharacterized protein n=1 Tax=Ataeniobius toweri TaxID=208326 RepID=A0ABU7ADQ1_9TELE|nr:hypothetical protein [Ataeniobius toweri]
MAKENLLIVGKVLSTQLLKRIIKPHLSSRMVPQGKLKFNLRMPVNFLPLEDAASEEEVDVSSRPVSLTADGDGEALCDMSVVSTESYRHNRTTFCFTGQLRERLETDFAGLFLRLGEVQTSGSSVEEEEDRAELPLSSSM